MNGCVFNVVLSAQTVIGTGNASTTTQVNIVGNIPSAKFLSKSQYASSYPGGIPTLIPIDIENKKCGATNDRIPINLNFQIYSGSTLNPPPATRGTSENQIENAIMNLYVKYQSLNLNLSQGFNYNSYYQMVMIITDTTTNITNNDTMIFSFYKPDITAVISPVGNIVSILNDVILNGSNSTIPEPTGDFISYRWVCVNAISFTTSSCSCPIFSNSALITNTFIVSASKLQSICKYTFSFTIVATSGNGYIRTGTSQVEFLAYKGTTLPVYGFITTDTTSSNNATVFFSFQMTDNIPDNQITYEWTLIQVVSLDPANPQNSSMKNTFIYKYLQLMNISASSSLINGDTPIPIQYIPTYVTNNKVRFLGMQSGTLVGNTQYTFGVLLKYPTTLSFAIVSFNVPQSPRARIFNINPSSGTGMTTLFSMTFFLPESTDIDNAQYQIYRRDCPSSTAQATPITPVMNTLNSYTMLLSAGQSQCNFQVEVILRAIEFGSYAEVSTIITIANSAEPAANLVADNLNVIQANYQTMTTNQIMSSLNEIANIPLSDASSSGKNSVNLLVNFVSMLDASPGGIRDIMLLTQQPQFLNTTASTLEKMLTTQTQNVDPSEASIICSKVYNYLTAMNSVSGGTAIIGTCVGILSGIVNVGSSSNSNKTFFQGVQQAVNLISGMKMKEAIAEGPPFSVSTAKIEVVVKNNYAASFNTSQITTTGKGSQMQLPANLTNQLMNIIQSTSGQLNNTVTVGTSVNGLAYDPYPDMDTNAKINASSISNSSCTLTDAATMAQIFNDMAAGKLNNVVNTKEQGSDIIEAAFTPFVIDKSGSSKNTSSSLTIGPLPKGKKSIFNIPLSCDPNNSLIMPLFYLPDLNIWSNTGCLLSNTSIPNMMQASCDSMDTSSNTTSLPKATLATNITVSQAFRISIDLIKDILNVLQSGNYKMLYSFGSFASAGWENYFVLVIVVIFLSFIAYFARFLNRQDGEYLFEESITTLYERFVKDEGDDTSTFMKNIYVFYSKLRNKGMNNVAAEARGDNNTQSKETAEKKPIQRPNGYNILTEYEDKKLKRTFHNYDEHAKCFPHEYLSKKMKDNVFNFKVLQRLTQVRLNDEMITKPPSYWRILKVINQYEFVRKSILI